MSVQPWPRWRQGWTGLPKVLALGLLLLVLLTGHATPAVATTALAPAKAEAELAAEAPVVELLRLGVPAADYGAWLKAEKGSWEPWLAEQPGFLERQLLWDRQRQEGTLLIRWASRAQWKAISEVEVARVQDQFETLARRYSGQASGNPFPLLAEAELEPLAASTSQPATPAPETQALAR